MSATTTNPCASALTFALLIGSMVLPALAREEIAVLIPGGSDVVIDGSYIVAGRPLDDDVGTEAGTALVYERVEGEWQQQAVLTANDAELWDRFGWSVAIDASEGGGLIVVGAVANAFNEWDSGAAYIFRYDGESWSQEAKLTATIPFVNDRFGFDVAVHGDMVIVGASGEGIGGLIYVFRHNGSGWVEETKFDASDTEFVDNLGVSLSFDGVRLAVGATGDDDGGNLAGAAYVFRLEGATWIEEGKLTASDADIMDFFGGAVSISGDYVVVGAGGNDDHGLGSGSAYVFKRTGGTWTEEGKLVASDAAPVDDFGDSVAIDGDRVIVGSPDNDEAGDYAGAAYLFRRVGGTWYELDKLLPSDATSPDFTGSSVAIDGNLVVAGTAGGQAFIFDVSGEIPTVSEWGVAVLTLLLLCTGTVIILRSGRVRTGGSVVASIAALVLPLGVTAGTALAQSPAEPPAYHPERLFVRFKPSADKATKDALHALFGCTKIKSFPRLGGVGVVHAL